MYLQKLMLKNFKCFENAEFHFHPNMTVIIGANAAGKTTVLEGAAIAVSTMFVKMNGPVGLKINESQVRLKSYTIGSSKQAIPQYPVEISAEAETNIGTLTWKRALQSSTGNPTIVDALEMLELGRNFQKRYQDGDTNLILPIIAYYGTGRLWDYHREKQNKVFRPNNRLNGYTDCLDGTANIKLMKKWFRDMTSQKYADRDLGLSGYIPELETVYAAMEACYRNITGCNDVKIQYNTGLEEFEIAYRETSEKWLKLSVSQLSDGYKGAISLVADIAYRMAVLNPQLLDKVCSETDGIVLIDEVDLHLHPLWQQRILGDLSSIFPKVQFIVTTHAPAVINTVKSENIVVLDNGEVYEPTGEVYGKDVNTIVSSLQQADERPSEIKKLFREFYRCIDENQVEAADKKLQELKSNIGEEDSEIVKCNVKLKLLKMRNAT